MPLVVGVDSSTQSVKVEVRDLDTGRLWASGRHAHPATTPPRSEQDPSSWWSALVQAVHEAGRYHEVGAIAVAGQQHGMVVLDDDGAVIRPAKLWNDTESSSQAAALVERLGAAAWAEACGSVPVAAFTVTKLAWLREQEPQSFARVGCVLLPHDFLTYRLCGRQVTDRGDASGTGYWSPREGRWRTDLLRLVDPESDWSTRLPLVLSPFEPAGSLQVEAARALGMTEMDVLVAPGTGDNMAAALGVGLEPGDVVVSLGTSGTVYAVAQRPTADPGGHVAGFADATGRFLPLVCTLNATKVTDAAARLMGVDRNGFDDLALQCAPGAGGLVLLPYLDGERTPNRPDATGVLAGIRSDVTRAQFARAAVEGVVCGLLDGFGALVRAGVPTDGRFFLVGGGARSRAYRQILADLAQRPVLVPEEEELVALGACVQAAVVMRIAAGDRRPPAEVLADISVQWGLGDGTVTEPDAGVDAAFVRRAYAAVRN